MLFVAVGAARMVVLAAGHGPGDAACGDRGLQHVGDRRDHLGAHGTRGVHYSSSRRASSSRLMAEISAKAVSVASVSSTRRRTASASEAGM